MSASQSLAVECNRIAHVLLYAIECSRSPWKGTQQLVTSVHVPNHPTGLVAPGQPRGNERLLSTIRQTKIVDFSYGRCGVRGRTLSFHRKIVQVTSLEVFEAPREEYLCFAGVSSQNKTQS